MKAGFRLLIILLVASTLFAQSGTRLIGFDAKSLGRGGTSIGVFDSGELMMTNPAGLSFVNQSMLNVDFSMMFPVMNFHNTLNRADGEKNVFPLPSASYVNSCDCNDFTWGVGFFTSGGMGADYKLNHALYGTTKQEYHSKLGSMQGGLSAAYKFTENFSVGASLHLVYSMLEFSMPFSLNPLAMQGVAMPGMTFGQMFAAPNSMGGFGYDEVTAAAKMSDLTALGFNGKIGLAYKVDNKLSFGLSYTMPTSLTYSGGKAAMDMTAQLNDAFGKAVMGWMMQNPGKTQAQAQAAIMAQFTQVGIDMSKGVAANYNLDVDLTFPSSFGFGVSYKAADCIMFAADVEYLMWENAFDKMTLKLKGGNNANINKMMGNNGTFNIDFPMNWKNSLMLKVGGEYAATKKLTARLGYAYNVNPVPETTVFPIFPAIVENHVMAGLSYKVSAPLTINAAFEMALNNSLKASNPSLIANEFDGSTSELSTTLIHISCSYAF
ncbi:MAG: outer membrane protein transport protein [Bacteroidota bacterium]